MPSTGPSPVEIKRYGETLARAIDDIRESGTIVRPTGRGDFCVGDGASAVYATKAELHGMAAKVREKRRAAMPAKSKNAAALGNPPPGEGSRHDRTPDRSRQRALAEPVADATPQGRVDDAPNSVVPPSSQSQADGVAPLPATPAPTAGIGAGPTCTRCGGPRSKWSDALCRACCVPAGRKPDIAAQAEAAGIRFAALSIEQQEAQLAAQKASFVRAEMGMGSDADEAEYRRRMRAGEIVARAKGPFIELPSDSSAFIAELTAPESPTADAPDKFARLADMVATRPPAPVREPTNAERIATLERQVASLRERLDQFTGEGR